MVWCEPLRFLSKAMAISKSHTCTSPDHTLHAYAYVEVVGLSSVSKTRRVATVAKRIEWTLIVLGIQRRRCLCTQIAYIIIYLHMETCILISEMYIYIYLYLSASISHCQSSSTALDHGHCADIPKVSLRPETWSNSYTRAPCSMQIRSEAGIASKYPQATKHIVQWYSI